MDQPPAEPEAPTDVTALPKADSNQNGNTNSDQYSDKEDGEPWPHITHDVFILLTKANHVAWICPYVCLKICFLLLNKLSRLLGKPAPWNRSLIKCLAGGSPCFTVVFTLCVFFRGDCCPWTRASSCGGEACEKQRESSSYHQNQQQTTNQGEAHFANLNLSLRVREIGQYFKFVQTCFYITLTGGGGNCYWRNT